MDNTYYLGFDIGSSSVKAALVEISSGNVLAQNQPTGEMDIISLKSGWAEQHPDVWWDHLCKATRILLAQTNVDVQSIKGIGIAYQMHGLVLVDKNCNVIRPSIIWCDSRATEIGKEAMEKLGASCLTHHLNYPGNFTASKLEWVRQNEPENYAQIYKIMLPGDYIAMKLTGEVKTTISGLSEAVLWDFKNNSVSSQLLNYFKISPDIIPELTETFGIQGSLTKQASLELGLSQHTVVAYRAGDQPNNAMSLGVLAPGEVAATGGTSGVVYGVTDKILYDPLSRVNNFAHVNHSVNRNRIGVLLCINGAGILYSWIKKQIGEKGITYNQMEAMAAKVPINSDGLVILPFGNGAERMLQNINIGASILNLQFNRHTSGHLYRATLEGIAYSFAFGLETMNEMGVKTNLIKVGNDNLFQSMIFSQTVSSLTGARIQIQRTNGAIGAAKASSYALGEFDRLESAFESNELVRTIEPENKEKYMEGYLRWKDLLLKNTN